MFIIELRSITNSTKLLLLIYEAHFGNPGHIKGPRAGFPDVFITRLLKGNRNSKGNANAETTKVLLFWLIHKSNKIKLAIWNKSTHLPGKS